MTKLNYAISIQGDRDELWYYYRTENEYKEAFEQYKECGDIHGYILNENHEYEVIDSYWDGEE